MAFFRLFSSAFFSLSLALSAPVSALAASHAGGGKKALAKQDKGLHINPHSLQSLLLERNNSLLQEMNKVYQAKENVNLARAQLLPSLNLGAAFNGGGFVLSAVSFLMPFLMPSNWLNLRDSQKMLNAETTSYYIAQLDQYASAYSVYMTVVSDRALRATLQHQYDNLKTIEDNVDLAVKLGLQNATDYYAAKAQAEMMANQVAQMDELLVKETASIREMLSLPLTTVLAFDEFHPTAVSAEGHSANSLLPSTLAKSPENAQIDALIQAAQAERWSKVFSFFNSSTLTAQSGGGGSVSFSHLTAGAGFNFGFSYFPNVALSNLNVQEMQLRKQEIALEQAQILESTLGALQAAKRELDAAMSAEDNYTKDYEAELTQYNLGTSDLLHVLTAANNLATASVAKIKSQTDVDTLRITLNRTLLREYFAAIRPCSVVSMGSTLFHRDQPATLDQVCGGSHQN